MAILEECLDGKECCKHLQRVDMLHFLEFAPATTGDHSLGKGTPSCLASVSIVRPGFGSSRDLPFQVERFLVHHSGSLLICWS